MMHCFTLKLISCVLAAHQQMTPLSKVSNNIYIYFINDIIINLIIQNFESHNFCMKNAFTFDALYAFLLIDVSAFRKEKCLNTSSICACCAFHYSGGRTFLLYPLTDSFLIIYQHIVH